MNRGFGDPQRNDLKRVRVAPGGSDRVLCTQKSVFFTNRGCFSLQTASRNPVSLYHPVEVFEYFTA